MPRYYIYKFYKVGNIGEHHIKAIEEQPKEGFEREVQAIVHLKSYVIPDCKRIDKKEKFTILPIWVS